MIPLGPRESIGTVARPDVLTCAPDTPVSQAAALMRGRRCGSIVVVEDGRPLGIWTERDAARTDFNDDAAFDTPVSSVMSKPLRTIPASARIDEVAMLFQQARIRHLGVVDNAGALTGIVSQTDLTMRYGPEHFMRLCSVGESLKHAVLRLPGALTLGDAARRMVDAHLDAALVDLEDGSQGIITERDLVNLVAQRRAACTVGEAASRPLHTIEAGKSLLDARRLLGEAGIRHLGVTDDKGEVTDLLTMRDIMDVLQRDYLASLSEALRERDAELLRSREDLFLAQQVIDSSASAIMVVDRSGAIESVNPAFTLITGHTAEAAVGRSADAVMNCDPVGTDFFLSLCSRVGDGDHWRGNVWCRGPDGSLRAYAMSIHAISIDGGRPTGRYAAVFHDATAAIQADEERRIAAIAFDSVTPMMLTDENARILRVNHAFTEMTGFPPEEAIGQTPAILKSGLHGQEFYAALWADLLTTGHWQGELWNRRRDGRVYRESLSISTVPGPDGKADYYVGTLIDVSERKQAQDTLREERDLIAGGPSVVFKWALSDGWPISYVSPNVRSVFGYEPEDLLAGRPPFSTLIHPDDVDRVAGEVTAHLNDGVVHYQQHYRFRAANGDWRWIDDFTTVVRDASGGLTGLNGYIIDVTDRVRAAREMEHARQYLNQMLGALGEAVYGIDLEGRCTFINPTALDLLGYDEAEVLGRDQHALFHHHRPDGTEYPAADCPIQKTLRDGLRRSGEERFFTKDGHGIPVALTTTPLLRDGVMTGAVASFHDISQTKASQQALLEERQRLENVIRGTRAGTWEWNVQTGETKFNDRWAEIIGHTLAELEPTTIETWLDHAHPEDLKASTVLLERHFAGDLEYYEAEARMRHKDGHWVWVLDRGKVVSWAADGKPEWMAGTHSEITASKAAEQALRESEERYRLAQTATGVGIWDWDMVADRIHWDANCWNLIGRPPNDTPITLAEWKSFLHPDDADDAEATVQAQLAQGSGFHIQFRYLRADGGWQWVQGRGQVVARDASGAPTRMMGTHTDISVHKKIEQVLESSRNRLDQLLGASPAVVYAANAMTYQPTYISANARDVFGLEPEEILSREAWWMDSLHPADRDQVLADAEAWVAEGAPGLLKHSYRLRHGNGSYVWVEDQLRLRRDDDGQPLEIVGSHVDITGAKEAEALVRASEEHLRALFDLFPDGLVLTDLETGLPMQFNPVAHRQLGYTEAEFKNLPIAAYEATEGLDEVRTHMAQIVESGGDDFETLMRRKDGSLMPAHVSVMPLDLNGRPCLLGVVRDITERHRTEEALLRSNAELEQFAYVASHDLRQPLRMITSYTQLLERTLGDRLDKTSQEFMGFIREGGQRMDQMLVSLLEYSRIGRTGEPMAEFDSRTLVEEALRFLAPAIAEAKAEVHLTGDWPVITASRNEGVRLFQNLIGNAVKYRAPDIAPVIELSTERRGQEWVFLVRDNGIGIEPKQFDRLFKVFQRLHTRKSYEGTGVGLAVCRKIVERHGGRIWVTSGGAGMGTTFLFSLPDRRVEEPTA